MMKKPFNSVRTEKEKLKDIANEKNFLSERVTKKEKLSNKSNCLIKWR